MVNYPPNIEPLSPARPYPPAESPAPWYKSQRVRIFAITFIAVAVAGLGYTFAQRSIYQSQATLLTSAPTSIDSSGTEADPQHVAIQRQILLGKELIAITRARLQAEGFEGLDNANIKRRLNVQAVADTNLVAMTAEGTDAELLPRILNTWIDVYLEARAADIEQISGHTVRLIQGELEQLTLKLKQARDELAAFRESHEIISDERSENEALTRLNGLQRSLDSALGDEIKARSTLETLREAVARGDTVIPGSEQRALIQQEAELQRLEKQQADLNRRYTPEYLALQPSLRVIPEQIETLSAEIDSVRSVGNQKVLEEAQQEHAAARRAVSNLRQQLDQYKQQVKEFTPIFAEHRSRVSDLENLEQINRETLARLTQIETRQVGKYPQVTIITRATVSDTPIGPDYTRNSIIALASALATSIFAVWLAGFLNPALAPDSGASTAHVYLYRGDTADALPEPEAARLENEAQLALGLGEDQRQNPDDTDGEKGRS